LVHCCGNLWRGLASVAQKADDSEAHDQIAATGLEFDQQAAIPFVQQDGDCIRLFEKLAVFISDGFCDAPFQRRGLPQ
jgi:hypothetical protein